MKCDEENPNKLFIYTPFPIPVPKHIAGLIPHELNRLNENNQANDVAEFLTRLNDCAEKNVFVVATTNRIDAIDPAIIRKGLWTK